MNRPTNLWRRPFCTAIGWLTVLVALLFLSPGRSYGEDIAAIAPQWIGKLAVFVVEISKDTPVARDIGFEHKLGLFVVGVAVGGSSRRAGVQRGDILVKMDFKLDEPGKLGSLKVLRGKELKDLPFTVPKEASPFPPELAKDFDARPKPITLVVDQEGKGNYRTITAALSIAAPGDTVEVRDGIYRESLIMPHGVTLCGAGKGCACVESSMPIGLFGARAVTLRQLTLRGKMDGVVMYNGMQVTLADCTISSTDGNAVSIDRIDDVIVQNCRVTGKDRGVRLDKSKGKIVESFITGCKWGVAASGGSRVDVIGNSLDRNGTALSVIDSQMTAEKNTMVGNSHASGTGVTVSDSQITLRGNTIQRFLNGFQARQVQGEIHGNTFVQNGYGIWLRAGDLNIDGNTFLMNANAAISLVRHSYPNEKPLPNAPVTAKITHNTISSNSFFGISMMDKAEANIRYNLIEGNARGIEVKDSSAKIINNTIVLQKLRGIELTLKSRAEVYNNIVAFNRWGIVVDVTAQWEHGFNNVFGNAATWSFPLASGDYVRCDRIPLTAGEKLLAHIYPADDLKAETDVSVDPQFVRTGKDYRLSARSPLADRKGKDGLLLGAFAVSAQSTPQTGTIPEEWRGMIEFRDTYRPNSAEASKSEYVPISWKAGDRELVYKRLAILAKSATGLLQRAATDGPISLYRIENRSFSQAKGGYRRLSLNGSAFPYPGYDWLTRIMAHELTHGADPYEQISTDSEWKVLVEPRIMAARALLEKRGLTTLTAAQMPLGSQRTIIESEIRKETGLPSAYAAHAIEETIAEVVSFMLDQNTDYTPPPEIAGFLRKRLLDATSVTKDPASSAYREGLRLSALKDYRGAINAFSAAIQLSPKFALAYLERAIARQKTNANAEAAADFSQAIALVSRYSRHLPFLQSEKQWCDKQVEKQK